MPPAAIAALDDEPTAFGFSGWTTNVVAVIKNITDITAFNMRIFSSLLLRVRNKGRSSFRFLIFPI